MAPPRGSSVTSCWWSGGRQLPFRGHAKASGDVCKGFINIDPNDTSVFLRHNLRWKHGNILCVRKLGDTNGQVPEVDQAEDATEQHEADVTSQGSSVSKQKSSSTPGKPGQVKTTDKAETRTQAPNFNAADFPSLTNAQNKVSGWVGAASGPLSPSPTEEALQLQNAELRRRTKVLANKIQELEEIGQDHGAPGTGQPFGAYAAN
ncbi:hypothetical protein MTO96_036124 [Rhipicephalus appendiculatus]